MKSFNPGDLVVVEREAYVYTRMPARSVDQDDWWMTKKDLRGIMLSGCSDKHGFVRICFSNNREGWTYAANLKVIS